MLPARVLCIDARTLKTLSCLSMCVMLLRVIQGHFFSLLDLDPEVLPPVRRPQVQINEGEGEIFPNRLSLEPGQSYNMR